MARPKASDTLCLYKDAKQQRVKHEADWRLASAYCLPRQYSAWNTEGPAIYVSGGQAAARRIAYDTTAMRALPKFMAVLERICTPHNMRWQMLTASDRNLASSIHVRRYFGDLNDKLFRFRYDAKAMFIQAVSEVYAGLGVYGTAPVYYGQRKKSALNMNPGFTYKACPLRDVFILTDDEGCVVYVFLRFFLNYRQFKKRFGEDMPMPKSLASQTANGGTPQENAFVEFIHCVGPRDDYDPASIGVNRHPVTGSFICVPDAEYVGDEQGFRTMPYLVPRNFTEAGDPYGFAPAAQALPAMGTASQIKKTVLKQGQKAVDPALLAHDDGVMNGPLDLRPGAVNYGGIDKQGREMVKVLQTGDFRVSDKLLADERADINDAFLVSLFQMFMDRPEQKEIEVLQMIAEKSMLVAPIMGRMQSELLGPGTEREIAMLDEMGLMPPMPPELIEAKGDYQMVYTSPMARGMYMEEVAGFQRAVENAVRMVEITQDQSYLDPFNFDVATPEMAEFQAVPARWMRDPHDIATKRDGRAKMQQQQQLMQNAAPLANAAKTASQMQGAPMPGPMQQGIPAQQPGMPQVMPTMPGLPGMPQAGAPNGG